MFGRLQQWPTIAILAIGMLLRVALVIAMPSRLAYDDHFTPIEMIVHEHRLPMPHECWECFQPPLYYVASSAIYASAEHLATSQKNDKARVQAISRKSVQCISLIAGCATLLVCLSILRAVSRPSSAAEAVSIGCIALLPQHIYMSAMATNDALTYFIASVAVLMLLRASANGWRLKTTLSAASFAGLTVLCKGYGWMTVASIIGATAIYAITSKQTSKELHPGHVPAERSRWIPLALIAIVSLVVAIGPSIRNYSLYNRLHVDNISFFPEVPMRYQPPGSLDDVDFHTFHFSGLLARPWEHMSEVGSFWTQLYARYWFDYEGLTITLQISPEWKQHRLESVRGQTDKRATLRHLLTWDSAAIPKDLSRVAIASYLAGLPITGAVLIGLVLAVARSRRDLTALLLAGHFLACLLVPVVQTVRLPFFSAMKAAFTLSAISSWPVFVAGVLARIRGRLETPITIILWSSLLVLLIANSYFVAWIWRTAS